MKHFYILLFFLIVTIAQSQSFDTVRTLRGHSNWVKSVTFSSNGSTIASGSHDNTIKIWDVSTGQELRTFSGHTNWVRCVTFSPNGSTIASGSDDKSIKIWDVSTGAFIRSLTGHIHLNLLASFSAQMVTP